VTGGAGFTKGAFVTSRVLYRIAAALILLFDIGHSAGFPWSDPKWGVDTIAVRSSHFQIFGFSRTYSDFYVGFGLFVSVFLLLAAVLAWQLGNVPAQTQSLVRATAWVLSLSFVAVTVLSWMYFFAIPIVFAGLISACLVSATAISAKAA
jgi:hypothetical protein